jgi:hypothetical protein
MDRGRGGLGLGGGHVRGGVVAHAHDDVRVHRQRAALQSSPLQPQMLVPARDGRDDRYAHDVDRRGF